MFESLNVLHGTSIQDLYDAFGALGSIFGTPKEKSISAPYIYHLSIDHDMVAQITLRINE